MFSCGGPDGTEAAPLAALQLAVRTWRAVGVLRAHAEQHPDAFDAFTAAQPPRAECPLAWQPVNFFAVALGSGFLLGGIGRVAACCRFLGGRRGGALWGQRAGVSLCEAAVRELCGRLDVPGSTRAAQTRLCLSAGRLLLRLAFPLPLAPRVCERTLEGHTSEVYADFRSMFPNIFVVTRSVLCLVPASCQPESVFSTTRWTLGTYCHNLGPGATEARVILHRVAQEFDSVVDASRHAMRQAGSAACEPHSSQTTPLRAGVSRAGVRPPPSDLPGLDCM